MRITLTVKAEAESKDEMMDTFPSQYKKLQKHFEALKQDGCFGPRCEIRFLIAGGVGQ